LEHRKIFGKEVENGDCSNYGVDRSAVRYSFDEFVVDPSSRTCEHGGDLLPVSGKAYDILLVFLENPGRLLTKEELLDRVWTNEFVEEGNLARNVSTLRKALGDTDKQHRYILTVPGHGYRFVGEIRRVDETERAAKRVDASSVAAVPEQPAQPKTASGKWIAVMATAVVILTVAWVSTERFISPSPPIRSLAVLPLKRLDNGENYLGIGIADAIIRRISQSHQLNIRPTSTILRFANTDIDTLAAGRELNTDAVLEGNVQSSGDRIRVSINLLRTTDGSSIWADNFDMPASDIFAVQDRIAQQVATRLRLHVDTAQISGPHSKYPANAEAYEFYIKGIFSLDRRVDGKDALPQMQETFEFFNKSIEADPAYALSHAQLAWAYAWTASSIDPTNEKWAGLAWQEIGRADELEPQIAETHMAKAMMFWSKYGNYQYDEVIHELQTARKLNPTTNHGEFAGILAHLGLEERAADELSWALETDPTSQSLKDLTAILPFLRGDADAWYEVQQKFADPGEPVDTWYYLQKGKLDEVKKVIDEGSKKGRKGPGFLMIEHLYAAMTGSFNKATNGIAEIVGMVPNGSQPRHHLTYVAACVFALAGNVLESVKWLKDTAATGFPNYPLFARDHFLDRIRSSPEFVQFIEEQKAQSERFKKEADE
jgi:DNA-binding winged helix-turn-helix (wHTH) protein/TolB-like protein